MENTMARSDRLHLKPCTLYSPDTLHLEPPNNEAKPETIHYLNPILYTLNTLNTPLNKAAEVRSLFLT